MGLHFLKFTKGWGQSDTLSHQWVGRAKWEGYEKLCDELVLLLMLEKAKKRATTTSDTTLLPWADFI